MRLSSLTLSSLIREFSSLFNVLGNSAIKPRNTGVSKGEII